MGIGDVDAPMPEGYTTLGFLAGQTDTVELQLLVTGVTYRHPGLLAKIVSTLDVLSGGRAVLGIGAAWYERLSRPHPPIMIGGSGEKKTLRLLARYGDAGNLFAGPQSGPEQVKAKLDVLAEHCEREGTDFDRIRKTVLWVGPLEPDAAGGKVFAEQMAAYARVGIEEVHVMPFGADPVGFIHGLGEHVIPRLRDVR
jgi:alkanesulfonate monooxygenase SsuD/methylene tetrahydromethanopterin reductase-like flavin-dependent oxidoreductase (luciferase family)